MSEALQEVRLGRKKVWALFDTVAGRSFVVRRVVPRGAAKGRDPQPTAIGLGGRVRQIREWRTLVATVDGCSFSFKGYVLDEIGMGEGRPIEVIVGAPVMEEWEIALRPEGHRLVLDLSRLRHRSFVDF